MELVAVWEATAQYGRVDSAVPVVADDQERPCFPFDGMVFAVVDDDLAEEGRDRAVRQRAQEHVDAPERHRCCSSPASDCLSAQRGFRVSALEPLLPDSRVTASRSIQQAELVSEVACQFKPIPVSRRDENEERVATGFLGIRGSLSVC